MKSTAASGRRPGVLATGLRAHTYVTALGLLAVTGMRISELVTLDNDDVDLAMAS
jgi:integrase